MDALDQLLKKIPRPVEPFEASHIGSMEHSDLHVHGHHDRRGPLAAASRHPGSGHGSILVTREVFNQRWVMRVCEEVISRRRAILVTEEVFSPCRAIGRDTRIFVVLRLDREDPEAQPVSRDTRQSKQQQAEHPARIKMTPTTCTFSPCAGAV